MADERMQRRFRSGDPNFVAACMAMGVPPDPAKPCTVTHPEDRPPYARYNLLQTTVDGKESVQDFTLWWTHPAECKLPSFTAVMEFIRGRPRDCVTFADWFAHAHSWLASRRLRPPDAPRSIDDVPAYSRRKSEHVSAYVFAFVFNRRELARMADKVCPDLHLKRGRAWATVSARLDRRQAGEILSRLKG